jgi:hypothetical protein
MSKKLVQLNKNTKVYIDEINICILEILVSLCFTEGSKGYTAAKSKAIWASPQARSSLIKFPESQRGLVRKLMKLRRLGYVEFISEVNVKRYPAGYWIITNSGIQLLINDDRALRKFECKKLADLRKIGRGLSQQ